MEDASKPAETTMAFPICYRCQALATRLRKGSRFRLAASVPFPFLNLLHEVLGFFFIGKGQAGKTFFKLEGVEEGPILIVGEAIVDFLVPYDAST